MAVKDFLNQPLEVGQTVIIRRPNYSDLAVGVVLKLTPQKAHVAYMLHYGDKASKYLIDQGSIVATDNPIAIERSMPVRASARLQGWLTP